MELVAENDTLKHRVSSLEQDLALETMKNNNCVMNYDMLEELYQSLEDSLRELRLLGAKVTDTLDQHLMDYSFIAGGEGKLQDIYAKDFPSGTTHWVSGPIRPLRYTLRTWTNVHRTLYTWESLPRTANVKAADYFTNLDTALPNSDTLPPNGAAAWTYTIWNDHISTGGYYSLDEECLIVEAQVREDPVNPKMPMQVFGDTMILLVDRLLAAIPAT